MKSDNAKEKIMIFIIISWKQIKKCLNCVKNFLNGKKKGLFLFLLLVSLFFCQRDTIIDIVVYNIKAIMVIFIPCVLVFYWLWGKVDDSKLFDKKSLLTVTSIIIAVLFFVFKNFEINTDKVNAINVANHHNCGVAMSNKELPNSDGRRYSLSYFIIEPYKESLGLAVKYPEVLDFTFLQEMYIKMESVNSLTRLVEELNAITDLSQSENIHKIIVERNKDIATRSEEIMNFACKDLLLKDNSLEHSIREFLLEIKKLNK
jgi:hypothetical protein